MRIGSESFAVFPGQSLSFYYYKETERIVAIIAR